MSVALISPPEEVSFSADFINAKFKCAGHLQSSGNPSINKVPASAFQAAEDYVIEYGDTTVVLSHRDNPDNSGNEIPNIDLFQPASVDALLPYLLLNPILTTDFDIIAGSDNSITFIAKRIGPGYDFKLHNTGPGKNARQKDNYSVVVKLLVQDVQGSGYSEVYRANLALTTGADEVTAVFGDKLHQRLTADINKYGPEIPTGNAVNCNVSCRKYFFQYGEAYGQPASIQTLKNSPVYTVIHGGLSYRAKGRDTLLSLLRPGAINKDRFLVQGPAEVSTRTDQPQYLYFLNTRAQVNATINCKFIFTDDTFAAITLETYSLAATAKFGFKAQFDKIFNPVDFPARKVRKYEIWLSASGGAVISEVRSFVLDYSYKKQYRYFLSWSSWGAMESRMFYGKGSVEFDLVQSVAERNASMPSGISQGTAVVFNSTIQTKFSITTGFIANKTLLVLNREFFISTLKYILTGGKLLPIRVTSKTIAEIEDGNDLFAQKFEYQYLFEDESYTEGDVYQPAPPPVRITGQIYFGPSLDRPVTAADVLALPNSAPAASYLIPVVTGPNKFINVAYPKLTKKWGSAFDNTSQENITSEYLPVDLVIDGILYVLRTMELARAYRESHDHILTITDV